jgi:hypothetical protein
MAGLIKSMLDTIVERRSHGNPILAQTTRTKLILKGVDPDGYSAASPDDPGVIARVRQIAADLQISL